MKQIIWLITFILISSAAAAGSNDITLLAVQDKGGQYTGSSANLHLESRKGDSRVFIETSPFTKLDTQISTRFAKDIACDYFSLKCSDKDFFYTITSNAGILGGASAGAAIALLTTANIMGDSIREDMAITGTINSGGIIGPVAGIKKKIDGAYSKGITTVLIPAGTLEKNSSIDDYAGSKNITVIRVNTLEEAYYQFTGRTLRKIKGNLTIDKDYLDKMAEVDRDLCSRAGKISLDIRNDTVNMKIKGLINLSRAAQRGSHFYSSASYCFGANIIGRSELFKERNYSDKIIRLKAELLKKDISSFKEEVDNRTKTTINDIQVAAIVMERILDADKSVDDMLRNGTSDDLSYAEERLYSAKSWYKLFGIKGGSISIDGKRLAKACIDKIREADERYQYVSLFFPKSLRNVMRKIDAAESAYNKKNYEICILEGSIAKAEANSIASTFGYDSSKLDLLVTTKIDSAKESLIRTEKKGIFPILAYSYYEYASDLNGTDLYSALQYAEYSLELSSFDIYLPPDKKENTQISERTLLLAEYILMISMGIIIGFSISHLLIRKR